MNRLTIETPYGVALDMGEGYVSKEYFWSAIERLAAYEDTCLEPQDVNSVMETVRKLVQAEIDGEIVALPCKIGDTMWTNISVLGDRYKKADRPYPVKVVFIGISKSKKSLNVQYTNGLLFTFDFNQIGKTVFLTREEAEAAL